MSNSLTEGTVMRTFKLQK